MVRIDLDKIRRNFFWGDREVDGSLRRKLHLISWDTLQQPKYLGGLNITSLKHKNEALLCKWWWRLYTERSSGWHKFIQNVYGREVGFDLTKLTNINAGSQFLKGLVKLTQSSSLGPFLSAANFYWSLQNGASILFWHDRWFHEGIIKDLFPQLFDISVDQNLTVSQIHNKWLVVGEDHQVWWKDHTYEIDPHQLIMFFSLIASLQLTANRDELHWTPPGNSFTTKECYLKIFNGMGDHNPNSIWESIWHLKVPPKISIFLWKFRHMVLPTRALLKSRIANSGIDDNCKWCNREAESLNHLFFECEPASWTWTLVKSWWHLPPCTINVSNFWQMFITKYRGSSYHKVWQLTLSSVLWKIWLARNDKIFNEVILSKASMHYLIYLRSFKWALANDWVLECKFGSWKTCPQGTIESHLYYRRSFFWKQQFESYDLVAVVDGVWKKFSIGGIGGLLKSRSRGTLLLFYGPSNDSNPVETELSTIFTVWHAWQASRWKNESLVICTDSQILVDDYAIFCTHASSSSFFTKRVQSMDLSIVRPKICHIPRELNGEAHDLATKGRAQGDIVWHWLG